MNSVNKFKWLRWIKWGLVLIVVLPSLFMALSVSSTSSFDGGTAYVSYSPDGKYRGGVVFIAKENPLKGAAGYYYLLTDPSGKKIYAIIPMSRNWMSSGGTMWLCGERQRRCQSKDEVVTGLRDGFILEGSDSWFEVLLPVSAWRRVHAWLAVRVKGLQDAEFAEMIVE